MLQFYMEEFGTSVSRACMGTMRLCSLERKEAFAILDAYRELGGNFLDSAHMYGRRLGGAQLADRIIGDWMRDRSCRGEMLVAGKGGHPPLENKRIPRLSRQEVEADLDESLMAMGIEQMDLYYLHRDDESRSVEEIMEYLWDFIKAGKIRWIGVSNWSPERIAAAQAYAQKQGKPQIMANQLLWNLAWLDPKCDPYVGTRYMDEKTLQYHQASGLFAVAYESQARGYFHKYLQGGFAALSEDLQQYYPQAQNQERVRRLALLAEQEGLSVSAVVLGYLAGWSFPSCAVIGCRSIEQVRDSMQAASCVLTDEQKRYLTEGSLL